MQNSSLRSKSQLCETARCGGRGILADEDWRAERGDCTRSLETAHPSVLNAICHVTPCGVRGGVGSIAAVGVGGQNNSVPDQQVLDVFVPGTEGRESRTQCYASIGL